MIYGNKYTQYEDCYIILIIVEDVSELFSYVMIVDKKKDQFIIRGDE